MMSNEEDVERVARPTDAGSADHEHIWLQPRCCSGGEGRLWCEDNVFEDECEGGAQPTEYLRADIAANRILALETRIRELEEASDPNVPGDILCKIISHDAMHEIAVELGYPSVLEALEDLALTKHFR